MLCLKGEQFSFRSVLACVDLFCGGVLVNLYLYFSAGNEIVNTKFVMFDV